MKPSAWLSPSRQFGADRLSGLSTVNAPAELNLGRTVRRTATQTPSNSITLTRVSLADLDGFDFSF
ncbi:hypothetical protein [uncultured Tateyamaria sp.]|uniref:hypothetical protein n=1 Tax=uncultured Tateyamaria sp. TaxID=455651 RepID=UPI002626EE48|nr:hypothetical protein [uncultured Tateyamaria sp.]